MVRLSHPGLALLLALPCSAFVHAQNPIEAQAPLRQDQAKRDAPGAEGTLSNDCFLPTSTRAAEKFERGDDALERARSAALRAERPNGREDATRFYIEAFETWQRAVREGEGEESVWAAGSHSEGARSLSEGAYYALRRRLQGLDPGERGRWTERLEPPAETLLRHAGNHLDALAAVARGFPLTASATRAQLIAADLLLEQGREDRARLMLERAARDLPDTGGDGGLARALRVRREQLTRTPGAAESWQTADAARAVSGLSLRLGAARGRANSRRSPRSSAGPMAGARPGLLFLSPTRVAVQTSHAVHLFRLSPTGELSLEQEFAPGALSFVGGEALPFGPPQFESHRTRRPPGWIMQPAGADGDLYLVQGHTYKEGLPNALLGIALPRQLLPNSISVPGAHDTARIRWAILGDEWITADGRSISIPEFHELEDLEFQPGPLVVGDSVIAQARSYGDEVRAWLFAFDRRTGEPLWKRLLAAGADLLPDVGRLGVGDAPRLASEPLLALGSRVFCGTNLGAGALVDALDGRPVWTLKSRRRAVEERGWNDYAPLLSPERSFLWPPHDSDRLYHLTAEALSGADPAGGVDRSRVFVTPPLPRDEARTVLGGPSPSIIVQGRAGREHTVSALAERGGNRVDALYLGPEEEFPGRGLTSETRVFACTSRGLYVFDRTRELYLLDYTPLAKTQSTSPGGDLYAQDGVILALGRDAIWSFALD